MEALILLGMIALVVLIAFLAGWFAFRKPVQAVLKNEEAKDEMRDIGASND
jgi:hypothetical protein